MPEDQIWDRLTQFRRDIHRHPEVAGEEHRTASKVISMLEKSGPDQIIEGLGGHGLAAVHDSGRDGPTVLFRCELDGLPIKEISSVDYRSVEEGKGHLCGHDGHMAILLGLGEMIRDARPERGRAVLLFQPAEETGEGADRVIRDPKFKALEPDYAYALHNLPGYPEGQVVFSDRIFSSASVGMEIRLDGRSSHAAEPENGINPARAVARIINDFHDITEKKEGFEQFVLLSFIQVDLGSKAYGTSAGHAVVRVTLRAYLDHDLEELMRKASSEAAKIAGEERLEIKISYTEYFPSTEGDTGCYEMLRKTLDRKDLDHARLAEPFRWSEDFGHFTNKYKGLLFGLGSGIKQPHLHNPDYDFPDAIIKQGAAVFFGLFENHLRNIEI